MLKEILSIGGKQGLFKLVTQGKNKLIVESLITGKRMPTSTRDKVVSLADISVFTQTGEVSLGQVLDNILKKENGEPVSVDTKADSETLRAYMFDILPDFDRERVYPSDIRKMISWYNLLTSKGITDFLPKEEEESNASQAAEE